MECDCVPVPAECETDFTVHTCDPLVSMDIDTV